jgi:hypothetical protein
MSLEMPKMEVRLWAVVMPKRRDEVRMEIFMLRC